MLPRVDSIKQMRLKIGITQKKLATLTGVSTSMIKEANQVTTLLKKYLIF
jgi:predicted transcriptional regulator